jgi:hypothetical protein
MLLFGAVGALTLFRFVLQPDFENLLIHLGLLAISTVILPFFHELLHITGLIFVGVRSFYLRSSVKWCYVYVSSEEKISGMQYTLTSLFPFPIMTIALFILTPIFPDLLFLFAT